MDNRPDERGYVATPPPLPGASMSGAPQRVIPLAYAPPDPDAVPLWHHWPIFATWAAALAAFFVMMWDVESVLVTGPILGAAGSVLLGVGVWKRRASFTVTGGSLCAICMVFVTCVNAFMWSPRQAEIPFGAMGAAYVIGLSAYSMLLVMRHRHRRGLSVSSYRD